MKYNFERQFKIRSPEEVETFIEENKKTVPILNAVRPQLEKYFPNAELSLEVSNNIKWTSETKLLINIDVGEEMFFNGMVDHMNDIYKEIEPMIEDIFCPVVLFPGIKNKNFEKWNNYSVINLMARTSYFNNDYDGTIEREITLRDIPYEQKKQEIMDYCKTHDDIWAPEIEAELQIDYNDVYEILNELENEGIITKEG